MKNTIQTIFIILTLLLLTSCGKEIDLDELIKDTQITFTHENDNFNYVTGDINLTHEFDEANKVNVYWFSNKTEIINNNGEVTLPDLDTTVTLTLTLSYKGESSAQNFDFLVKGKKNFFIIIDGDVLFAGVSTEYILESPKEITDYEFLYYIDESNNKYYVGDIVVGPITLTSVYKKLVNLDALIKDVNITFTNENNNFNYVTGDIVLDNDFDDVNVSWSSNNEDIIDNSGKVSLALSDITVTLTLTLEYDNEIKTREFEFLVKSKKSFYITINEENFFNGVPNELALEHPEDLIGYDFLYYTDESNNKYYVGDIVVGPITLTTYYIKKVYTVNFYLNNTLYKEFSVTHDNFIEPFPSPEIEHGSFLSWQAGNKPFNFEEPIKSDLKVDANILLNKYKVNFYLNDELYKEKDVDAYSYLNYIDLYEDGFNFDGWYKNPSLIETFYFHNTQILSDINLYATKSLVTIRDVFSYNKEGTFKVIAYIADIYSNYTYISDLDGFSRILEKPSKPSGLSKGDKVLIELEMKLSGGRSYIKDGSIKKILKKENFHLDNIHYNSNMLVFDDDNHLARKFHFFELEVYEVDNYYIYASIVNHSAYPKVLYIKINHRYLNKTQEDLIYLKHKRIEIENIYLYDIEYFNGYTLSFNLYDINDFKRLDLNDEEKLDDAFVYLLSVIPDTISEGNLNLPKTHTTTTITWESDKPNIITNDGTVNYQNMTEFEEVVRLNFTIISGEEKPFNYYFDITVIDNTQIITNTIKFDNVGLKTEYSDTFYIDENGVGFIFNHIKKKGSSFIMSTSTYSNMSVEFPNGLISFSFKYRVQARRPLDLNINVTEANYPYNNYLVKEIKLNDHTSNYIYTYVYDGASYLDKGIDILLFLNESSGGYEIEILEFTYKAVKGK